MCPTKTTVPTARFGWQSRNLLTLLGFGLSFGPEARALRSSFAWQAIAAERCSRIPPGVATAIPRTRPKGASSRQGLQPRKFLRSGRPPSARRASTDSTIGVI